MKRFLVLLLFALILMGQTVYTRQDPSLNGTAGAQITGDAFSDLNPLVFPPAGGDWVITNTQRTMCFDIELVDANSSITSVDMSCYTSRVAAGAPAYRIPVFTATSGAGITTSVPSRIRQVSITGGAPGTSNWTWCVTNIPGPRLSCQFLANGVITVDIDTLSVFGRGIVP